MAYTRTIRCLLAGAVALLSVTVHAADYAQERQEMLDAIRASVRETADYTGLTQLSGEVMTALGAVPRERFVLPSLRHMAYDNTALPIAEGQTISQPLIVALMTHLVQPSSEDIILEVGTGSGYQAAVLAKLVKHVYSIEIIPELAHGAADLLAAQVVAEGRPEEDLLRPAGADRLGAVELERAAAVANDQQAAGGAVHLVLDDQEVTERGRRG